MTHVDGAFVVDNLIGVPSYHFDPAFARVAASAFTAFRPSVVALELPDGVMSELEWAASCWPGPVVSASAGTLFPFVPGDSIFEAFRLATAARVPVVLIDLDIPAAEPAPEPPHEHERAVAMGAELSRADAGLFLEASDSLRVASEPLHSAREAHMARSLTRLLAQGESVMWVGGMAHWTAIVKRIAAGNIADKSGLEPTIHSLFERMRVAPSALHRMTGRLPWLVARYAQDPSAYDEHAAIQSLCLEATRARGTEETTTLVGTGRAEDLLDSIDEAEATAPVDVARTLQYARNLAATKALRERPTFGEMLTAAAATIGPKYAGRLYESAMNERASPRSLEHEALEWEVTDGREEYRCGDRIIESRPWWPPKGGALLSIKEIRRRSRSELHKDLPPAGEDAATYWECSPTDEDDYVSFVEYVLRRASFTDPEETKSAPFRSGLRDGLDVRATLRNWAEGTIYVREVQQGRLNFRNGAIDWVNASEHSDLLTGKVTGGWIDPSLTRLGSCSRTTLERTVLQQDPFVSHHRRDFTFITLDAPTSHPTAAAGESESRPATFYDRVIQPLVNMDEAHNDLYAWLDVMFEFCAGKPFAYYSRYVPSPEIHRRAWRHKVRVVHFPLQRLPARLLERHTAFRFFAFTREQWEEFQRRRSASAATWAG